MKILIAGSWHKKTLLYLVLILLLSVASYYPTFKNDFTNWDDDQQITENPHIREFDIHSIGLIFTSDYASMYQPVTTLLYAIEYQFWGLNPVSYHAVSLVFHLLNIILLYFLVILLFKKRDVALIVSALFACHPVFVEVVSWLSAFSTLVYTFFYLCSLICYSLYLRINEKEKNLLNKYYLLTILFFILALLSKVQALTLPFVLLLFDFYFQRKIISKKILFK